MSSEKIIKINTPALTRVEGEGALDLVIKNQEITELKLRIFEPPRFFEKFLEGREYPEVIDIVARVCGICPVAYQMSAVEALEQIFNLEINDWTHNMRRLHYCGEWIQSHALHIHLLALPDFLGFQEAISMSKKHPLEVERGFNLQKLGNELVGFQGGRSVHPVGVQVGGFFNSPSIEQAQSLAKKVSEQIPQAQDLINWLATIEVPEVNQDFISVALSHPEEYPMIARRIVTSDGLDIDISEFDQHFKEKHIPHSTALHAYYKDKPYLVGPIARLNLHQDKLPAETKAILDQLDIKFPSKNIYHSMLARAIEIHAALIEAKQLLAQYQPAEQSATEVSIKAGIGFGASEAPRGMLWHTYQVDDNGLVKAARLVPPTSQNQAQMEHDIAVSLTNLGLDKPADIIQFEAERVIRNYDPCISCATHFLKVKVNR